MLIVFAGLPGAGKTTIARALAQRLRAVHIRIDTIEQALRASGVVRDDVGPAGYLIGYGLAADNLRIGRNVVADSVNPIQMTRDAWRSVGQSQGIAVAEVEVICSDRIEHRRRVETRTSDIGGLALPSWQMVIDRDYEPWDRPPIVVDTAVKPAEEIVSDLFARFDGEVSR
jgi:predicted kinase